MENDKMSELDMNNSLNIPLYRIPNEVKLELLKALNFWNQHSIIKNSLMVIRANNDLENNYSTTANIPNLNNLNNLNNSSIMDNNLIPSTANVNNVNINANNSDFLLSKLKNGIEAFKNYLKSKKSNDPVENKLINDLLSTYDIAIESVLK